MKNSIFIIVIAIIATTFILTGCTKDSNTNPDSSTRTSFIGNWSVSETWTKLAYEVKISADPNSADGVFISNFANTGATSIPASASVNGSSIILDANQVIGEGLKINGSGNLSGTKISWSYSIDNGADQFNATAIYTKQ